MDKKLTPLTDAEQRVVARARQERELVEKRFPLVFGLLITFGFVSTLYGFEKLIDNVDWFVNNPWILLVTGLTILVATGAAYKKLN